MEHLDKDDEGLEREFRASFVKSLQSGTQMNKWAGLVDQTDETASRYVRSINGFLLMSLELIIDNITHISPKCYQFVSLVVSYLNLNYSLHVYDYQLPIITSPVLNKLQVRQLTRKISLLF